MRPDLPLEVTLEVRDRCLCLHLQRAARSVARLFDDVLRPFGLTNGQFSLLMSLNRPVPPRLNDVASLLAMDRTTLTAALKPLQKRGLLEMVVDENDKRARLLLLTDDGREVLKQAVPIWRKTHDDLDKLLTAVSPDLLRQSLMELT